MSRKIKVLIVFFLGIIFGVIAARLLFRAVEIEQYTNLNSQYAATKTSPDDPTATDTTAAPIRYSSSPVDNIQYHDDPQTIKNKMDGGIPFGTSFTRDKSGNLLVSQNQYNIMATPMYYDISKNPTGLASFVPNYETAVTLARESTTQPRDYLVLRAREQEAAAAARIAAENARLSGGN